MELNLTTWQRITLVQILGAQRGPVAIIRKASRLLDILELTDEERASIGLGPVPDAPGLLQWADPSRRWALEVPDKELVSFLKQSVEAHDGWQVANTGEILDLCEQLGIE